MADDKRVDEIRARLEKATTGPWKVDVSENFGNDWPITTGTNDEDGKCYHVCTDSVRASGVWGNAKDDAIFLAHSRSDIEYLLSELDEARKRIAELEAQAREYNRMTNNAQTAREAAEAENVRLRDALTKIAEDNPFASVRTIRHLREIARVALEGK